MNKSYIVEKIPQTKPLRDTLHEENNPTNAK